MTEYHFYDTSSLILRANDLFSNEEKVVISTTVLEELENLKISNRPEELKYLVRKVLRLLAENTDKYEVVIYKPEFLKPVLAQDFSESNDTKILAAAIYYDTNVEPDNTVFYTNDLSLKNIANVFFGEDMIASVEEVDADIYTGVFEVQLTQEELAKFYTHQAENPFCLNVNEYLIIKDENGSVIDRVCWTGRLHRGLKFKDVSSKELGKIKPKDEFQMCALDSMQTNLITMICGKPGSGKTALSLYFLFSELDRGEIDRIVIFCNPVVARNAARLGFYPGTMREKVLSSSVGNILASKIGGMMEVERLLDEEKLVLIPAGDARGYEVPKRSGVYIMEAQNLDVVLMKMLLQRIGDGCKVIIDGDHHTQTDEAAYEGDHNGMNQVSRVFRGKDIFGQVELKNIYRSKIAETAEAL